MNDDVVLDSMQRKVRRWREWYFDDRVFDSTRTAEGSVKSNVNQGVEITHAQVSCTPRGPRLNSTCAVTRNYELSPGNERMLIFWEEIDAWLKPQEQPDTPGRR